MREVEPLTASRPNEKDEIELVCASGHRTIHSLKRVLRLNDGWCGKCGADISYQPSPAADPAAAGPSAGHVRSVPDGPRLNSMTTIRNLAALASACESDDKVAAQQEESQ